MPLLRGLKDEDKVPAAAADEEKALTVRAAGLGGKIKKAVAATATTEEPLLL